MAYDHAADARHRGVTFLVHGEGSANQGRPMPYDDDKLRHTRATFTPLDQRRVVTVNPREVEYWCNEFGCSEAQLKDAVERVGEHVAEVRRELRP